MAPLNISGSWGGLLSWPLIGLHVILTPDGKILTYGTDNAGDQGGYKIFDVWDPVSGVHTTLPNNTYVDEFCSAAQIIPGTDQVILTGGDSRLQGQVNAGIASTNIYDPTTDSLTVNPSGAMNFARWYPTLITLDNGQLLVLGGRDQNFNSVGTPEIFTPGYGWRALTGAYIREWDQSVPNDNSPTATAFYPRTWEASNGKIITFADNGGRANIYAIDPSGNGHVTLVGQTPTAISWDMPAIMYAPDKSLILGDNGTCWIMNISGSTPVFTQTGSLAADRQWSNLTVLADGRVMVSGGSSVYNKLVGVDNNVEIWNPSTGVWTSTGAVAAVARLYHSDTILLPNATVLNLGGGAPGPLTNTNGQIYTPGYLFNANGAPAVRPVIEQAPHDLYPGQTFTVVVDNPSSIQSLALMPFGSTTHSFDMTARRIPLPFTVQADGSLSVTLPANSNLVTPGDWMLFAINKNDTPSVAATIQVHTNNPYYMPAEQALSLSPLYMVSNGEAHYEGYDDAYALTPNGQNLAGSEMSGERIDLSHPFSLDFEFNLGSVGGPSDGIAFVLHNDPLGSKAIGGIGDGLGAWGIANGLGIEFDTWQNTDLANEPALDHTNFFKTADFSPVTTAVKTPTIGDGTWHSAHVGWNGQSLTYSIDGTTIATLTQNIAANFLGGSQYAYFGFTGGTGGATGEQLVRIDAINATLEGGTAVNVDRSTLGGDPNGPSVFISHAVSDITNQPTQTISGIVLAAPGNAAVGGTVTLYDNGNEIGTATVGSDGNWATNVSLTEGTNNIVASNTDAAGHIGTGATTITLDTIPPTVTIATAGGLTNQAKQTISGTVTAAPGEAPIGSTVAIYDNGKRIGTAAVVGDGNWTTSVTLTAGLNVLVARNTDAAGNVGNSEYLSLSPVTVVSNGSAQYEGVDDAYALTPNGQFLAGSAMSGERIDLSHPFSLDFEFNLGSVGGVTDGIAFVLQNDPLGSKAIGGIGDGLGAWGIANGLGIEFDTWQNTDLPNEPALDHTNFFKTTDFSPVTTAVKTPTIGDGTWHTAHVGWNGQSLTYSIDGTTIATLTQNIAANFLGGSQYAYFGFTGGTGGAAGEQLVRIDNINATLESGAIVNTDRGAPPTDFILAPTVTSVTAVKAGGTVQVTLKMSEKVTVSGTPILLLNDGGSAKYVSGSGSTALKFNYTGPTNQGTKDLKIVGATLPSSTAIVDAAGNAANLALTTIQADLKLAIGTVTTSRTSMMISGTQQTELFGPSSIKTTFAAGSTGTLKLDAATSYTGTVAGLTTVDRLDLANLTYSPTTTATTSNATKTSTTLNVTNGTQTAKIVLLGNYIASTFTTSNDGYGGTMVVDPHTAMMANQTLTTTAHTTTAHA
jgi:hypothetical protein